MNVARCAVLGFTCLISGAIYPQEAESKAVNNSDFLEFTNEQKKFWLFSAIEVLGFVAGYKDAKQGRCVWEWFHQDVAGKTGLIIAHMEENQEVPPSAILIALTENDCGAYVRL